VDPIDDFRATNPPSNPELLDALAQDFIAHGFDLRHAARRIMNSRTYQLSSVPNETNRDDNANASRGVVRRLTAEQLLDAQCQVLGTAAAFDGYPRGMRAGQLPALNAVNRRNRVKDSADQFLLLFGKPERLLACECERSDETTLSQAFQLISGPTVNELLSDPNNRLARLAESDRTDEASVRELFWDTLSRAPTAGELSESLASIAAAGRRRDALEDLAWALLNAKEFILRH
jgi:hypothetical protein